MSEDRPDNHSNRFEVRVTAESHFAWLRTRLAVERTMMAYLRTAVSLTGFGFAIFQIAFRVYGSPDITSLRFPRGAWFLGLALILSGVMTSVFAAVEYRRMIRYLWSDDYAAVAGIAKEIKTTPLYAAAFVVDVVGVFSFFVVLLRIS
jgi:putative membrane protein